MDSLPAGYKLVGGLSLGYSFIMAGFLALSISSGSATSLTDAVDILVAAMFVLTPAPLFLAGFLLCFSQTAGRLTVWTLLIAGLLLLAKAAAVTLLVLQALTRPTSSTSVLALVLVPVFIMPASIWGVVVLLTVNLLRNRIRSRSETAD